MLGGGWSIKEKGVRNRKEEEGRQAYIKNGLPRAALLPSTGKGERGRASLAGRYVSCAPAGDGRFVTP